MGIGLSGKSSIIPSAQDEEENEFLIEESINEHSTLSKLIQPFCIEECFLWFLIPMSMIAVGSFYHGSEFGFTSDVSYVLLNGGVLTLANGIIRGIEKCTGRSLDNNEIDGFSHHGGMFYIHYKRRTPSLTDRILTGVWFLLAFFIIIWYFSGAYLVFRLFPDVDFEDKSSPHYCNNYLYFFAFIIFAMTLMVIVAALVFIVTVGLYVYYNKYFKKATPTWKLYKINKN